MQLLEKVYGPANETVVVHCTNILEEKMGERPENVLPAKKIEYITGTEFPTVLPANSCVPVPSLSLHYNTANRFQPNV